MAILLPEHDFEDSKDYLIPAIFREVATLAVGQVASVRRLPNPQASTSEVQPHGYQITGQPYSGLNSCTFDDSTISPIWRIA
jgi:hypothetical protein